jgi:DNA-binding MarR family transcriptional regulator
MDAERNPTEAEMPERAKSQRKEQQKTLPALRSVDPDCPDEALTACPSQPSTTDDRARALKLWVVFNRAFNAVRKHLDASVTSHGLTEGEFGILEVLFHKGPLLLGEVQRKILASSGGVTYLVDRLEKKGLVRRDPCPSDRRALYAVLTPEGERVIGPAGEGSGSPDGAPQGDGDASSGSPDRRAAEGGGVEGAPVGVFSCPGSSEVRCTVQHN